MNILTRAYCWIYTVQDGIVSIARSTGPCLHIQPRLSGTCMREMIVQHSCCIDHERRRSSVLQERHPQPFSLHFQRILCPADSHSSSIIVHLCLHLSWDFHHHWTVVVFLTTRSGSARHRPPGHLAACLLPDCPARLRGYYHHPDS